ncbi:vacuolar import and degradation protein Vid28 [Schizosaccharomyces japonicus yFS275]|uniref:Vacuolar import and degradation protein Vid28 n=1 Tax=Schizosaccharomyces japonicus (strain yFS275 / FY16936) TaxID=402676 RepID=B6K1T5_SCHJY|nr:vacuolar import and degradation protein Vid28 [Schizosaccharomyces japonicus yFS275]EEB07116.1 vacuolar import and degradation protein Vid28 [Schizosaccharomyces japonicus yFS275]
MILEQEVLNLNNFISTQKTHPDDLFKQLVLIRNAIIGRPDRKDALKDSNLISLLMQLLEHNGNTKDEKREIFQILRSFFRLSYFDVKPQWLPIIFDASIIMLDELKTSDTEIQLSCGSVTFQLLHVILSDNKRNLEPYTNQLQQLAELVYRNFIQEMSVLRMFPSLSKTITDSAELLITCVDRSVPFSVPSKEIVSVLLQYLSPNSKEFPEVLERAFSTAKTLLVRLLQLLNVILQKMLENQTLVKSITECDVSSASKCANRLLSFIGDSDVDIRLPAATALARLYLLNYCTRSVYQARIEKTVIPTLSRLLEKRSENTFLALQVLELLLCDNEDLQKAAVGANIFERFGNSLLLRSSIFVDMRDCDLHQPLSSLRPKTSLAIRVSKTCYEILAILTSTKDEYRKLFLSSGLMKPLIEDLSSKYVNVRIASCEVLRSLSRSVFMQRVTFTEMDIVTPLLEMLHDPSITVRSTATSVVCNITLGFSPLKSKLLETNVVDFLFLNLRSEDEILRMKTVWALRHIVCDDSIEVKRSILHRLEPHLSELVTDRSIYVQEQVLQFFRNFLCQKVNSIDLLLEVIPMPALSQIITDKLSLHIPSLYAPCLFTLVHIAAGNEVHKSALISQRELIRTVKIVVDEIINQLQPDEILHDNVGYVHETAKQSKQADKTVYADVVISFLWLCINLLWVNNKDSTSESVAARANTMREAGFVETLKKLQYHSSPDVLTRVHDALTRMDEQIPPCD